MIPEFKKILTADEVKTGFLLWEESKDEEVRRFFPSNVADFFWHGEKLHDWSLSFEDRRLTIGEPLKSATAGHEIVLSVKIEKNVPIIFGLVHDPADEIVIRKRLSLNEFKGRKLKWFAREDELYRRLFPPVDSFSIEIDGKCTPNRKPDYDKRTLAIGEAIRAFTPGDTLLVHRSRKGENISLVISREKSSSAFGADAMTSLRSMVTRLISRPLSEFNDGEVKGLIALLDENKNLWERLNVLREENDKLKERVITLEDVFEQFSRNSFFGCKKDFEEWIFEHLSLIERGLRLLHKDYSITLEDGKKRRLDLLCQDRKGALVAVEVLFNPTIDDLDYIKKSITWLRENVQALAVDLSEGKFQANSIRGMVVSNQEKTELVECCLQNGLKLCVINGGFIVDIIE
ncbi:MAG: DUF91 domain-containing protein [Candidatus Riflebacteria bacterium]|nr:DUF91 domain-containing protein [Candidatus Riflebacteria bacterium]